MRSDARTPEHYIRELPADRKEAVSQLREVVLKNLPDGFEEVMSYGMLGYVVPHKWYPAGYHCDPKLPLPFAGMASQKNFIAFYHMGIYAMPQLYQWFVAEYSKYNPAKLDMGKSCMRYKKPEDIPFDLIGELAAKITPDEWIAIYEKNLKR